MIKLEDVFDIQYGHSLELNRLIETRPDKGIAFVSRKAGDNGISAYVENIDDMDPAPEGELTCALSGNGVLSTFIQERPFYTGFHVARLKPKFEFTKSELLFYCLCIKKNRYKYSYGRQANRTLKNILVPSPDEIPPWVNSYNLDSFGGANKPKIAQIVDKPRYQETIELSEIFDIENGIASTGLKEREKRFKNSVMYIRPASTHLRTLRSYIDRDSESIKKIYPSGTLFVSTNGEGSHSYSYVSTEAFVPNSDISVLIPKKIMPLEAKFYYAQCITSNRPLFSYGRKPKGKRLAKIRIPYFKDGDYSQVEKFINSLAYSSNV